MEYKKGNIYHLHYRCKDDQKIFYRTKNYFMFLERAGKYIKPYCDILAWCLTPDSLDFLLHMSKSESETVDDFSCSVSFEKSVKMMFDSYNQYVNDERGETNEIFSDIPYVYCVSNRLEVEDFNNRVRCVDKESMTIPINDYPQKCFEYIHQNPVEEKLVMNPKDWIFSSYRDFLGLREGKLVNKDKSKEFFCFNGKLTG